MIYLAANNSGVWKLKDMGFSVGWFMSPKGLRRPVRAGKTLPWALDNGLFRPFGQPEAATDERLRVYSSLAKAVADDWPKPLFAVVPDVPYDGKRSIAVSRFHLPMMRQLFRGIPLAIAVQDGMVPGDGCTDGFDWIFVGGSDEWKDLTVTAWCNFAAIHGLHVHMARVNDRKRMMLAKHAGCYSADGTGIWRGDKRQKRRVLDTLENRELFVFSGNANFAEDER